MGSMAIRRHAPDAWSGARTFVVDLPLGGTSGAGRVWRSAVRLERLEQIGGLIVVYGLGLRREGRG